jgi:CRP/FNR family cyclic AMP-dependent transcriptional regulator
VPVPAWSKLSFLGRLPDHARDKLLRLGMTKIVQPGKPLVRQGDASDTAYLLLSGRVNVQMTTENGSESLLGIRYPGDLVGEMAMMDEGVRTASVIARERCTVLALRAETFMKFLREVPEASFALHRTTGDRLNQANAYRADAAGYDVDVRLARALLYQARRLVRKVGGCPVVELRQAELAMLIGAKEGTVQKALNGPRLKPLARCQRGRVFLLDVPGLAELSEFPIPDELT